MKTIFHHFLTTLKRYKVASALNVAGMSVAFAAFIVIMAQVRYDRNFDKFHARSGTIYRTEISMDSTEFFPLINIQLVDLLRPTTPEIGLNAMYTTPGMLSGLGSYVTVEQSGSRVGFKEVASVIEPDFLDLFDIRMIEGDRNAIREPGRVLIPRSLAEKFFGTASPIDQNIFFSDDPAKVATVGGVYADLPENTMIRNTILLGFDRNNPDLVFSNNSTQYTYFVELPSAAVASQVSTQWRERIEELMGDQKWLKDIRLTPIEEAFYATDTIFDVTPKGSRAGTTVLFAIALLIIGIAAVNFVNFSTSLTPLRMKSINTRKVLGSTTSALRGMLLAEAVGISLIALVFAVVWVQVLSKTSFVDLFSIQLGLRTNLAVYGWGLFAALAVGLAAGLYPAYYTTSFSPALVLKGSFGLTPRGKKLRMGLLGFQFIVSIGLIIAALFMQIQNNFMRRMDTGLNVEHVAFVQLNETLMDQKNTLINLLKEQPQVAEVAFSDVPFGLSDINPAWQFGYDEFQNLILVDVICVSWNLPGMLQVRMTEGHSFTESTQGQKIIVNETAVNKYGWQIGQTFDNGLEIIGIMEDFNHRSLHHPIGPMALLAMDNIQLAHILTTGDPDKAADAIRSVMAELDPSYPADVKIYDTVYENLYMANKKTTWLITIFSLLAVIISLVGVFGLVMFETQYRKKEIGVRKVMGATVEQILAMFNKRFFWIVTVCFVLAAPLAWYGIRQWLLSFAYRTPLHWWVFAFALLIVMLITLITVTVQSWRCASANPVHALKTE